MTSPTAIRPRRGNGGRRRELRLVGWAEGGVGSICGNDVDMDNGPRGLSQTWCGLGMQRGKGRKRVDDSRVPAFESDLHSVRPTKADVLDAQLLGAQGLDPREAAR